MLTVNNMPSYQCLRRENAHHTSLLSVKRSADARKRCISPNYTAIVAKNIGFSSRNNLGLFCQASFNRASFHSTGNSGSAKWAEYKADLNPLRRKRLPIYKIQSHPSESLFLVRVTVLIIRVTFWSSYDEIFTWPIRKILLHFTKSSCLATLVVLIIRATFWSFYDEILTLPHYDPKDGQFEHCSPMPPNHRF